MKNYEELLKNITFYLEDDQRNVTNLANLAAYLFYNIEDVSWVGFYLHENGELFLGPFQGKPACTNIKMGTGVCGDAAAKRETIIVKNVHEYTGHIACDTDSNSEIVLPIITKSGELFGVLDIDSTSLNRFDDKIKNVLENIIVFLVDIL